MDIFKFRNPTSPTKMEQGIIVNGLTSKLWVERYAPAGEFTFVAPANIGMRDFLPIGTFVSHVDTPEIMIVENHEINEGTDNGSTITITGRGYETFLERRQVGSNDVFPRIKEPTDLTYTGVTADVALILIERFTDKDHLHDPDDAIPYMQGINTAGSVGQNLTRNFPRGSLYQKLLDLLNADDLGIRVWRPGPLNPLGAGSGKVAFAIHKGVDRRDSLIFSHDTGEIVSADYLWSNKLSNNAILVYGKWVEILIVPTESGYDRRMTSIDASDIDDTQATAPVVGSDIYNQIVDLMTQRGKDVLASMSPLAITKADISGSTRARYRVDYDVGDIVKVSGNYDEVSAMRVIEHVEIEDETGERSYPTLSIDLTNQGN